jgi:very-short-patch-repair endonuclease
VNLQTRRLLALLEYAQESMRTRARAVSNVTSHGSFVLFDHQVEGFEGTRVVAGASDGNDEPWLSVAQPPGPEIPPVTDNQWLVPWLSVGTAVKALPGVADEIDGAALIAIGTHRDSTQPAADLSAAANPEVEPRARIRLADYAFRAEVEKQYAHYLQTAWKPWAEREQRRRRQSHLYVSMFTLQQQLSGALTETQLELVWGMGIATRRRTGDRQKNDARDHDASQSDATSEPFYAYPLVTHLVDIGFNEHTRAAEIRPRNVDARLELEVFLPPDDPSAIAAEKAAAQCVLETGVAVTPGDPESYASLIDIARRAIGDDPHDIVEVANSWVLFARPRGSGIVAHDLERMRGIVIAHGDAALPGAVACLVTDPGDDVDNAELPVFRGYNATYRESITSVAAEDLFFPKPFNDEQARVAQQLEVSDGVVVQGPPGTGKSHTIANIICHWLATGRRVLVTSMRDPALAVLRDQLPEAIRPLVISLLASEQEGMQQLERSIEKIAQEVQSLNRDVLQQEIERLETGVDALQGKLARLDRDLTRWAKLNLSRVDMQGQSIDPQDAAREVMENVGNFEWIPDPLGVGPQFSPQFSEQDIARLRHARKQLGTDIEYVGCNLPVPDELPEAVQLVKAHDELQRFVRLNELSRTSALPWPQDAGAETVIAARELAIKVDQVRSRLQEIISAKIPWTSDTVARIRRRDPKGLFDALDALAEDIGRTAKLREQFLSRPVHVPEVAFTNNDFMQALDNLVQGRRAFALTAFGKANARKQVQGVQVNGVPPASPEDWQYVADFVAMQRKRRELTARWNAVAPEIGFKSVLGTDAGGQLSVESQFSLYDRIRRLSRDQGVLAEQVLKVFPDWSRAVAVADDIDALDELAGALEYHLTRSRISGVSDVVEDVHKKLHGASGRLIEAMRAFLTHRLGKPAFDEAALITGWGELRDELERLHTLTEPLNVVENVTRKIFKSGGVKLATLLTRPVETDNRELLPDTFMRDWRLRRLATHIAVIDSQAESTKLNQMRTSMEHDLARLYEELVVRRTWFKLAENVTPSVRAALQGYLNAIQRIGKGAGKRAHRYRQDARYAAAEAHKAIPCWIMPHHRVSETLPAQLGSFDLVVIDESSQSDLSALPVLLRAKKILVVGDDRQVSPQAIGMEEDRVQALMQRHLSEQVPLYRAQLAPDRSFYDLARVVFARTSVMLREHFRCVAPIIEYARREFYNNEIYPLRLPRNSERIDPPLQDVYVTNGHREDGINEQEVDYIVNDIVRRSQDPRLHDRSIGVVSLLGENQALRIWERLLDELGAEAIRRHDITCGDARMFQGRERDIMYLTMVAAPNEVGAPLGRDTFAQRFNVAASRARDQMILVRSVDLDDLTEADRLRRGLIQHFAQPFGEQPVTVVAARELCESQLERDLYDWLNTNGYRVMPQVRVGAYRIDLVVEGEHDTRLAVECDGDRYEGAEQWIQAIRRQRALERTGWAFWRCFATSYLRREKDVIEDLRNALDAQGIEPTRSGGWARRKVTETRRVLASNSAAAA